jgi:Flp pilus assembly protein TadD
MAISDSMIQTAMQHLRAGHRGEAAKVLRDVCLMEPNHIRATCMLAVITYQEGDAPAALSMLDLLAEKNPRKPEIIRSRAEILLGTGDLEGALAAQTEARMLNPKDARGHLQEGVLLERMGKREEARQAGERAVALDTALIGAQQLLASLAYRRGDLEETSQRMLQARSAPRPSVDPNHHLALALFGLGRMDELHSLASTMAPAQAFGETMVKAIAAWRDNDPAACAELLVIAQPQAGNAAVDAPNRSVFITYGGILDGLLAWRRENADRYGAEAERTIHVVGDSHVLTSANLTLPVDGIMTRFQSHLAFGCKAWHLVREEESPYRGFYRAIAARIPQGATVVAAFGELDCRLKEGIMRVLQSDPKRDWRAMVDELIESYVAFMMREAEEHGWTLWLQTPPMTNITANLLMNLDRSIFLGIIKRFNERLREVATSNNLRLIDVKAVTTEDDHARYTHYIDTNHVRPSALIAALENAT